MNHHDDDVPAFCAANAYLDRQVTALGDWHPEQYIAIELGDYDGLIDTVEAAITSFEARDLAFLLLELAELADYRARGGEETER